LFALLVAGCQFSGAPASAAGKAAEAPFVPFTPNWQNTLVQPAGITARYFPNPDVQIKTPSFATRDRFTTQQEMMDFIAALAQRNPALHVMSLGRSAQGREIPLLVFTHAANGRADTLKQSGRPTVWIHAQIHGDEPAAGEAALAIAAELSGPLANVLEQVNVVVVPRVNPDGARGLSRYTANQFDANRDAIRQLLSESRAVRQTNLAYQPIITVDVHEFNPARDRLKAFGERGYLEAHDMMLLGPLNPNVPAGLRTYTDSVMIPRVMDALASHDYLAHRYFLARPGRGDGQLRVRSGGSMARIGRNYHGLLNQVSILLESRGIALGRTSFKRRVHSHLVALRAILRLAVEQHEEVTRIINRAIDDTVMLGRSVSDDDVVTILSRGRSRTAVLPYIDLADQRRKPVTVPYLDLADATPYLVRRRPRAYLLPPGHPDALETLADIGLQIQYTTRDRVVEVEAYRLVSATPHRGIYEGTRRKTVRVNTERRLSNMPAGTAIIYMDQPLANLAVIALEPEGSDSLFSFGLLPTRKGRLLPTYRYLSNKRLRATGEPASEQLTDRAVSRIN
jgi:hypothetical protein